MLIEHSSCRRFGWTGAVLALTMYLMAQPLHSQPTFCHLACSCLAASFQPLPLLALWWPSTQALHCLAPPHPAGAIWWLLGLQLAAVHHSTGRDRGRCCRNRVVNAETKQQEGGAEEVKQKKGVEVP